MKEGPPYAEMIVKAGGGILQRRLQEHLRSRGVGAWASAVTSEKASYRVDDVLNFLERHLPKMEEGRRWRMMFADDAKQHLPPPCAPTLLESWVCVHASWRRRHARGSDA